MSAISCSVYLCTMPKEEILESVWNDCSVSDTSLTRSVATLRRLLRDDTREPRYIATVPTLGYRFLCPVEVTVEASAAGPADAPPAAANGINQQSMSPPPEPIELA